MRRSASARQGGRSGDFLAGKYLLENCLGIGGMGEVYRATNVSLGRKVAIKLLSPEYVHIEEDVLRFLREARAAAAIRHANVVDVLDVARDDDGTPFIVQELLDGEDLERYLRTRGGRLSPAETLEIMIPVADAVAAAHAENVVHRDLKPANIFLARDRNRITPKVLDFGACLFPTIAERSAKEVRMLIGTPHYMAPEQIVSKADVDARSDVWALGVILYEMLVGETPFEATTANAVLELVTTRDVPPVRARAKDAPADLEELIARCTRRDRLARMTDGSAVHEAMQAVRQRIRGAPFSSRSETIAEHSSPAEPELASVPSLEAPTGNRRLLTLSSPGSEPPPASRNFAPPRGASDRPRPRVPSGVALEPPHVRELEAGDGLGPSLDLAAQPSSWPPPPSRKVPDVYPSSIPPVLDPRAARWSTSSAPRAAPDDAPPAAMKAAGPPAALARDVAPSRVRGPSKPSFGETSKLGALVALPALAGFVGLHFVPGAAAPVGRALRGDSTFASGALAIVALVVAAALSARSVLGERSRSGYAAAAGGVLFGIVMIIVTFAASETAELGMPTSMSGISTLIAPIAPFALALGAVARARAAWSDPYGRREAVRLAAFASLMLFVSLALSPVGAVRTPSRASQAVRSSS